MSLEEKPKERNAGDSYAQNKNQELNEEYKKDYCINTVERFRAIAEKNRKYPNHKNRSKFIRQMSF